MDPRRVLGNRAERLAAEYLERKGYEILARQYTTRFGEVDLIAKAGEEIVFVEVKWRQSLEAGYPEESVHPNKLHRLQIAAEAYLCEQKKEDAPHRYDVVAMVEEGGRLEIEHLDGI
ncbi:YraN family protein [Candidatus Uhrbacteria bacterium]|nr:YraN family protein [Candidatus Uhrbacteria bacterium]